MSILTDIQQKLNAPKNQYNNFGKYKYRSCEDILEGLKPHLKEHNASVVINDDLVLIGDRYYVKSTSSLYDKDMQVIASNSAYAREELTKKGMDGSQITGTASSYARKYSLNGLFLIDDTKDADSMDNSQEEKTEPTPEAKPAGNGFVTEKQVKLIQTRISKLKLGEDVVSMLKTHYNIESWKELPFGSMQGLMEWFDKQPRPQ